MLPYYKNNYFIFFKYIFLFLFLASDGRIIVYGGIDTVIITDKLVILDTKSIPFQWTIPKNIVYPIKTNHWGHTSNLYGNYMITAFSNQ